MSGVIGMLLLFTILVLAAYFMVLIDPVGILVKVKQVQLLLVELGNSVGFNTSYFIIFGSLVEWMENYNIDGQIIDTSCLFGGSVELDNPQVSGARPILNTTQGGTQAGVGVFGSKENVGYAVTVYDDGGGNKYYIDGVKQDTVTGLIRGATYTFDTI